MPAFVQQSSCDLHIPHPALSPSDPNFLAYYQQNNMAIQRWAAHFYRNCASSQYPPIFSWPGLVTVSDPIIDSPPWWPNTPRVVRSWRMKAMNSGVAELTIYLNGSPMGTIEFTNTDDASVSTFAISLTPNDKLNVAWTDVGSGDLGGAPRNVTLIGSF